MRAASQTLVDLLATRSFVAADLYTITYAGGGVDRFTTCDTDIVWGGLTYAARGGVIDSASRGHWKVGLDVDTWQFRVAPRNVDIATGDAWPDRIGSTPWAAATRAGALDGANVQVDRAYLGAWPQPWRAPVTPDAVLAAVFVGQVAGVDISGGAVSVTVNSALDLLTQQMPRDVYQAACRHTLFDSNCGLAADAWKVSGTIGAGSTQSVLKSPAVPPSGKSFARGYVRMTSGLNAGYRRSVRLWTSGEFTLLAPLPFVIATGDAFYAYPGCDKTRASCGAFSNSVNFGGQPYIPAPETAI